MTFGRCLGPKTPSVPLCRWPHVPHNLAMLLLFILEYF